MAIKNDREGSAQPIRVTFVQPAIAKYRIPVFQALARRPGIDLRVVFGTVRDLPNEQPTGFVAEPAPLREFRIGSLITWHAAEWHTCSRKLADVLVFRWSPRSVSLLPALVRAKALGIPTILWGHGYSKDIRGQRYGMRKFLANFASAIVFYDSRTRDGYVHDGWDPSKLFVAPNSLDNAEILAAQRWWHDHPGHLSTFRSEHSIGTGPVVLYVSRLLPANRVDLLIQATAKLVGEIPGLKTVIIGNGSVEKLHLESLAKNLGVSDNVVFQDGIYDEQKLAPWFLTSNVFCYPANIGLSLLHAMWYGLPVVTTDNMSSQNPEVVALKPGVNSALYQHGNIDSLASALRAIVTQPDRRNMMSQAARATVAENFTIPNMVDGLESAIRYVVHSK